MPLYLARHRVLVADPAWKFDDQLPGDGRGAESNYEGEELEDLHQLVLPSMHKDCYLGLWRVSAMVEEAYEVVRAHGFTPKCELVWRKLTRRGKRWFGMGRTVRNEHETCIIATRGKPHTRTGHGIFRERYIRSTFEAKVPSWINPKTGKLEYKHSGKPSAFYRIMEELFEGPYVERNSRVIRPNWTCIGREGEWYQPLHED